MHDIVVCPFLLIKTLQKGMVAANRSWWPRQRT